MRDADLTQLVLDGNIRAAGRLMRKVDDDLDSARPILSELFAHTGKARIIGVTGNPGAGKSTLVNHLISSFRALDMTVGCIAVDPTSPFSGGAILGDRVRMQQHALDRGVFIRSVATRGNLGGISRSTPAIVQVLDAMGFDIIIIETVGVGQDEIDIVRLADTSVVVTVPGLGDDVQASKAGIMEIGDLFVINKADRNGFKRLRRELRTMIEMGEQFGPDDWKPPVLETIALQKEGIDELRDTILAHLSWLDEHGESAQIEQQRLNHYIHLVATGQLEKMITRVMKDPAWSGALEDVKARAATPYDAAATLVELVIASAAD